jgi:hypothetical protein
LDSWVILRMNTVGEVTADIGCGMGGASMGLSRGQTPGGGPMRPSGVARYATSPAL